MEKVILLLWGDGGAEAGDELRARLLEETGPRLLAGGVRGLSINVHDRAAHQAPAPVPTPAGEDPHVAEVSVWLDCYEGRGEVEATIGALGRPWASYLVVESLYEDYGTTPHAGPRDWAQGTRSPGLLTVALIHRPEGLGYRDWIDRWHGTQSPVSAELQPRTRYVRNEVVRSLSPGAPDVDGIVEEGWPSAGHIADPMLFFDAASPEELEDHVGRMLESVGSCLDMARLRSSTMSEYLIKSVG